ncbi:arylsulfatase [Niabella aurantiaca]|uniref:arylsulfatase n=1 Tax=Niabella aurantiaca TaxID=379900 RepID=UPI000684E2B0|nr:arylsulfatase [Niabella aurantiaca]
MTPRFYRNSGLIPVLIILLLVAEGSLIKIAAQQRPNIVLILADDLGYGDVGVYGQQKIRTPHIDRLAREGKTFRQFYTGTAVCAPSRSSLLTGQHTGHTPIRGNKRVVPEGQWPLPAGTHTIAQLLKNTGYTTGCFGKWGLGFPGSSGDPVKQGFDRFYGYNCQTLAHDYFPDHLWDNGRRIEFPNTRGSQKCYAAEAIHDRALAFIQQNRDGPFFLFLAYTLPHAALQLPEDDTLLAYYKKAFHETPVPVPGTWDGKGYRPQAYPKAAYAAMVGKLDGYVGDIMSRLKALGIDKNTLVIFSSDNGPHKEGGNDPVFFNSSGGLKGIKRDLYEGGIRAPFITRWPGKIKAGTRSDFSGAFWDLLPTFAALAGTEVPADVDGISIVPALLGEKQKEHPFLYWELHEDGGKQAVRMGRWKGVRKNVFESDAAAVELYDLRTDPGEQQNVAATHPQIVSAIAGIMSRSHTENPNFPFVSRPVKKE